MWGILQSLGTLCGEKGEKAEKKHPWSLVLPVSTFRVQFVVKWERVIAQNAENERDEYRETH